MGSSVHIDNKGKDILIFGKGQAEELEDDFLTAINIQSICQD